MREISSQEDLQQFLDSNAFHDFIGFIQMLAKSVEGKSAKDLERSKTINQNVQWAIELLESMTKRIEEFPPISTNSRFGNPAFRSWLDAMRLVIPQAHEQRGIPRWQEVASYLVNSLGDWQRIDYGTGHEAHFVAWLYCLCHCKTGPLFTQNEYPNLVLMVFFRYLRLMRLLQSTYWLEPAGSHGVWGLDDYHFISFLWGAAQLVGHPHIPPKSIHDRELVEEFSEDYLYFSCIDAINKVKKTGLAWHSPMLNDISAVRTWEKVLQGLVKMYRVEVLGKLPIMQHFLFGTILPFKSTAERDSLSNAPGQHMHGLRGDCCGNPLPSIYSCSPPQKGDQSSSQACKHIPRTPTMPFD